MRLHKHIVCCNFAFCSFLIDIKANFIHIPTFFPPTLWVTKILPPSAAAAAASAPSVKLYLPPWSQKFCLHLL